VLAKLSSLLSPRRARLEAFRKLQAQGRATIGRYSYAIPTVKTFANDSTRLDIGSFTSIGPNVSFILGGNHPIDRMTSFPLREKLGLPGAGADGFPSSKGDIIIGNDVWIGFGSTIVSGVTIGDGAIVLAGSMVTASVDPYTVVGGVPARYLRPRFTPEVAQALLHLKWWEWDDDAIRKSVEFLSDFPAVEGIRALGAQREASER
jgi:acetyltransferase-like isoleucine patch superfamily enzyme